MSRPHSNPRNRSHLSAIVLAAGLSRRAAPHNKLLLPWRDTTVVRSTVDAVCQTGFKEVIVVTGHQREAIEMALNGLAVRFVYAADFELGMGHSLAAGARAAQPGTDGLIVTPADLPELRPHVIAAIAQRFIDEARASHIVPTAFGDRGHPVVLGNWLRNDLAALEGDTGARILLVRETEKPRTVYLETGDKSILRDVDRGV